MKLSHSPRLGTWRSSPGDAVVLFLVAEPGSAGQTVGAGTPLVEAALEHAADLRAGLLAAVDLLGPAHDGLDGVLDEGVVAVEILRARVLVVLVVGEAHEGDEQGGEAPVERAGGEGRDGEGLDVLVEGGVVVLEALVVGEVAGPGPVEDGADEAGRAAADPARGLDVLGGGLGLAGDDHEPEAADVHAHGDHVGREEHVERDGPVLALARSAQLLLCGIEGGLETVEDAGYVG